VPHYLSIGTIAPRPLQRCSDHRRPCLRRRRRRTSPQRLRDFVLAPVGVPVV